MKMKKWIRLIFILIGGFLLFYFIAPLFAHILNIGNLAGIIFSAALICLGLFLNPILKLVRKIRSKKEIRAYADSIGLDLGENSDEKSLKELQEIVVNFQEEQMENGENGGTEEE